MGLSHVFVAALAKSVVVETKPQAPSFEPQLAKFQVSRATDAGVGSFSEKSFFRLRPACHRLGDGRYGLCRIAAPGIFVAALAKSVEKWCPPSPSQASGYR
jgi:hypothetical protein